MDDRAIARWRMRTLGLIDRTFASPTAVVAGLLAVQAENLAQASWAVAARSADAVRQSDVRGLLDDGAILRTHVLRPTWHFVAPDDIRWLVELTAPRIRRSYDQLNREIGLTSAELDRSREVVVSALEREGPLTRDEIAERLEDAGRPASGQRLGRILGDVEATALVCSGPAKDGDETFALLAERAPTARRLDRRDALAEIVLRYFTGHGPATERDLAYWASLTLTDVRAGLADVRGRLDFLEHDGRTYWFAEGPPSGGVVHEPRGHLLQVLDEYHNGYQDSRYVLDADGIVPRGRGATVGMALVDGQMVGGMRRSIRGDRVVFAVHPFRGLAADELEVLQDAAQRYGGFLGLQSQLEVRA